MKSKRNTDSKKYVEEKITVDYILNLYEKGKSIDNEENKKIFIQDVKKLIPHIGKTVILKTKEL